MVTMNITNHLERQSNKNRNVINDNNNINENTSIYNIETSINNIFLVKTTSIISSFISKTNMRENANESPTDTFLLQN